MTTLDYRARTESLNQPDLSWDPEDVVAAGWEAIGTHLSQRVLAVVQGRADSACAVAIDGYAGTDWPAVTDPLRRAFDRHGMETTFLDAQRCFQEPAALEALLAPHLSDDPVFGRLYKKGLTSLMDPTRVAELRAEIVRWRRKKVVRQPRVLVCYGAGALTGRLRSLYDLAVYADLTREEALRRNASWSRLAGKTQSISPKRLYYVDFQVHDRHRNRLLNRLDYYLDANREPVLLSAGALRKTAAAIAAMPFKLKYMYEPGPWGGQWLKEIRELPEEWVNCAWSFEVIAQEMSLLIDLGVTLVELPWTTFFHLEYDRVLGWVPRRRFGGEFPIRFDYLDTMAGGDLSIQVHPTTAHVRRCFGEPYHQGEMYYIVDGKEGATVNLGLVEGIDKEAFRQAARLADEKGVAFDYRRFVHHVPAKKHDLLLIPPGTVHGSGEGLVVLEVSATTYRYTFKIYDHLRPDLNGVMRPIHLDHAFQVIKWFRRSRWVNAHLKPSPLLIRSGAGWAEYLIGDRPEFFHIVFRLEFDREIEDATDGHFCVMTLVEGESVELVSPDDPARSLRFRYSETVIVPACLGRFRLVNRGTTSCQVVKARLR